MQNYTIYSDNNDLPKSAIPEAQRLIDYWTKTGKLLYVHDAHLGDQWIGTIFCVRDIERRQFHTDVMDRFYRIDAEKSDDVTLDRLVYMEVYDAPSD